MSAEKVDTQMVKLQSSDGKSFEWPLEAVLMSKTIKTMIEDLGDDLDCAIPLPNVSSTILQKVEEYCNYHLENDGKLGQDELKGWDTTHLDIDRKLLKQIIMAANYLDIEPLLDATLQIFAADIKGKNLTEIRAMLEIIDDLTPERIEQIDKENKWIDDA